MFVYVMQQVKQVFEGQNLWPDFGFKGHLYFYINALSRYTRVMNVEIS